jgi:hypothetical protein
VGSLHSVLIDNLEGPLKPLFPYRFRIHRKGVHSPVGKHSERVRTAGIAPPPRVSRSGTSDAASGSSSTRSWDIWHVPKSLVWPPLLRPTPDPEVEIPFYLPQLPDDTGPAGMGRNDQPDVPSVEVELPFSASVRQTSTTNPRSASCYLRPHMARRPFEESELPFPGSVDRGSVIIT